MVSLELVWSLSSFRSPQHNGCTFKQESCFYQRNSVVTPYCGEAISRTLLTEVIDVQYEVYGVRM